MRIVQRLFLYLALIALILMTMHGWMSDDYQHDGWVFILCVMGLFFIADTTCIVAETDLPAMFIVPIFGISLVLFYIMAWHIRSIDLGFFAWFVMVVITHALFIAAKCCGARLLSSLEQYEWTRIFRR